MRGQAVAADRKRLASRTLQAAPRAPGLHDALSGDSHVDHIGQLQRLIGNAAVVQLLRQHRPAAGAMVRHAPLVQRCGSTPCGCSPEERQQKEAQMEASGGDVQRMPAVRPTTPRRATGGMIQRHQGFRTKGRLESDTLATDELQTAASSADLALEVNKSSGDAVSRLQQGLNAAGHAVPISGTYDAATQQAVASFQREHGIPFPTGRQAGPKTLSTLDDHLLGKPSPKPKPEKKCTEYEPGEREASQGSAGFAQRFGTFGTDLKLTNFAAGKNRMKPEHEAAVKQLIKDFDLFEPESNFEVEFIRGFTDSVDAEDKNAILREARADDVTFFMQQNGVPAAPAGQAAAEGSFDPGCDPFGRRQARSVFIRLKKRPKKPKPPGPPVDPPDTPQQACGKTFQKWSLQGVAQGAPPIKPGATGGEIIFMLRAKDDSNGSTAATRMISFTGVGGGAGIGFPVTIPLPSETAFETLPPRRTFDDFAGGGIILDAGVSLGIGFSLMQGEVHPRTNPEKLDLGGAQLGLGASFEVIGGEWKLLGGCF